MIHIPLDKVKAAASVSTTKLLEAAEVDEQLSSPTPFADGGGGGGNCGGGRGVTAATASTTARQYKTLKTAASQGPRQQPRIGRAVRDDKLNRKAMTKRNWPQVIMTEVLMGRDFTPLLELIFLALQTIT